MHTGSSGLCTYLLEGLIHISVLMCLHFGMMCNWPINASCWWMDHTDSIPRVIIPFIPSIFGPIRDIFWPNLTSIGQLNWRYKQSSFKYQVQALGSSAVPQVLQTATLNFYCGKIHVQHDWKGYILLISLCLFYCGAIVETTPSAVCALGLCLLDR